MVASKEKITRPRFSYWTRRTARHLLLACIAVVLTAVAYHLIPPPDVRHRLSMGSAYAAIAFAVVCLLLGPWNVLRSRPNPVSFDLRRDIGIWAGILALFHTGVGLTVHLRGRMWMYFFSKLHPLTLQKTQFGLANYLGLVSALLFLLLLLLSNSISLRSLGVSRWKALQRLSYVTFALAVAHGVLFQLVEKRHVPWLVVFWAMVAVALVLQGIGFVRMRKMQRSKVASRVSIAS